MTGAKKLLMAAAGGAGGDKVYVDDVFSTFLYTGNSANQDIVNGIDLAGEGGMVWTKRRDNGQLHGLFDTERGVLKYISSDASDGETTRSNTLKAFNSDGFQLGAQSYPTSNSNGEKGVSWSFRKQPGFFDIQTYTGNNSGQTLTHDLGCVPAMIWIKRTDFGEDWVVYHVGSDSSAPEDYSLKLNETEARSNNNGAFNDTAPTSTQFTVGNSGAVSQGGKSFVAYLFAGTNDSDSQIFGDDSDESIIKCGSYTGNGNATGPLIDLGFEPQFVMIKAASRTGHWFMLDVMRGITTGSSSSSPGTNEYILANSDGAEGSTTSINVNSTGFQPRTTDDSVNENNATYTYMAIRRSMKTPEAGTEVLSTVAYTGTGENKFLTSSSVVDLAFNRKRTSGDWTWTGRLQGAARKLVSNGDFPEGTDPNGIKGLDYNNGVLLGTVGDVNSNGDTYISYMLTRATGFFDVVAYTGDGSGAKSFSHNLGVAPELMILKGRSLTDSWFVFANPLGASARLKLETTVASGSSVLWDNTLPTATQFRVGSGINPSTETYINYLFATVAGVSKVGSVTHSGTTDVDCGFSAGARFVMAKRTDSSGDWFIWDSVRGIVSGDDPYLRWNVSSAEVTNTDYIDPLSSGFTLTSSFTAGTYIFLAIA